MTQVRVYEWKSLSVEGVAEFRLPKCCSLAEGKPDYVKMVLPLLAEHRRDSTDRCKGRQRNC